MTLIFAALLGNVLAWCVHLSAWWLREKCLWLVGWFGYLMSAVGILGLFVVIGFTGMRRDSDPKNVAFYAEEDRVWDQLILQVAVVWFLLALLGWWQARYIKIESRLSELQHDRRNFDLEVERVSRARFLRSFFSIGAIYAEIVLAAFVYIRCANELQWPLWETAPRFELGNIYFWTFLLSLLVLALFRAQSIKVQMWLTQQLHLSR